MNDALQYVPTKHLFAMIAVQTTLTDTPQPSVPTAQVTSTTWSQQCCPISVRRKVRSSHLYVVSGLENLLDPSINSYSVERKLIHDGDADDVDDNLLSTGLLEGL